MGCLSGFVRLHRSVCAPRPRLLAILAFFGALAPGSYAQSAHFAGVESVVSQGLVNPVQVQVDSAGNVYVLDAGSSRVLKEAPGVNGYQESIVTSTAMKSPSGLALDASGDLFVVDAGNNRLLEETPSGNTYAETVMAVSGLSAPSGIAVDATGNLYISDTGNSRIIEETLIGTNYSQTTLISGISAGSIAVDKFGYLYVQLLNSGQVERLILSGSTYLTTTLAYSLSSRTSVAVDSNDVVYILDGSNANIIRELSSGSSSYIRKNVLTSAGSQWAGLAVDGNRNLYFSDTVDGRVLKLSARGADFGTLAVGRTSSAISLIFGFDQSGTIASTGAVTQGLTGLDYSDAGTGSCATNGSQHYYSAGDSCTFDVLFTPKAPGGRYGAAILYDGSGNAIATGYIQGFGSGPQVRFPAVSTKLSMPGLSYPTRLIADAAGNLYILNAVAAFDSGNAVYKETWTGGGYVQSTVATNLAYPLNIKVDGAGNVYVLDEGVYGIYKYSPTLNGGYTKTTFDTANSNSNSLGVDGFGDIYFASGYNVNTSSLQIDTPADGYYGHQLLNVNAYAEDIGADYQGNIYFSTLGGSLLRETPSNGTYVQSTVPNASGQWLAVDGLGNLYVDGPVELSPNGSSYTTTSLPGTSDGTWGIAVGGNSNIYLSDSPQQAVWRIDFSQPPALHFAATAVGQTSTDSPQTLTIENSGNAPLTFPVPGSGSNPAPPSGFNLNDNGSTNCPTVTTGSGTPGTLNAGASCVLSVNFSPQSSSDTSGWLTLTDDALNASAPAYTTQQVPLAEAGAPLTPAIDWATPAAVVYGTALGPLQLSATTNVAGTFSYSPGLGTVLGAGAHTLSVTFTPSDAVAFNSVTATVNLVVNKAVPTINWATPAAITYGTALSSTQLNANCAVAGTLTYSPAAGAILTAGAQTLSAAFTPTDMADYTTAASSVSLTVNQAIPTITWATPGSITYGTALGSTQLNATTSVPGNLVYSPAAGTVLGAGSHLIEVIFTPTDSLDYMVSTNTVILQVNPAAPTVAWVAPGPITYGTALSGTQLDATANVPGRFVYSPAVGAVLGAGAQTLKVTFTPTDATDYTTASASVSITVGQATPTITWPAPTAITYGTALSGTQLDATANVPGRFVYSPAVGAVLGAGAQTLKVTFTPTDATDYTTASASVNVTVGQATPTITWPVPTAITYGTALGGTQLDATANVAGTLVYSPAAGTVLGAGAQTLKVTFTPTDATDYTTASASVNMTVGQATPTITWPVPAAINYGTALSGAQLDATANVPGTFVYSPAAGAIQPVGNDTLSVTFTPNDATDYTSPTATVSLVVNPFNPTPGLTSLSPAFASAGGSAFTLNVQGSAFQSSSVVYWGTTALSTQYVSSSQLTAQIPASDIANSGTVEVTVQTPAPGGGASGAMEFEIDSASGVTPPAFATTSVTVTAGAIASYPVALPSVASNVSATCLNLPAGATCSYSASSNTLTISTSSTTPKATYQITVVFTETLPGSAAGALFLPLVFLPLAFSKRISRKGQFLAGVVLLSVIAALSAAGCGGSGAMSSQQTTQVKSSGVVNLTVQ